MTDPGICRLCLMSDQGFLGGDYIEELITSATGLQISCSENESIVVCQSCFEQLESSFRLRKRAEMSLLYIWRICEPTSGSELSFSMFNDPSLQLFCHACNDFRGCLSEIQQHISREHLEDHLDSCSLCQSLLAIETSQEAPDDHQAEGSHETTTNHIPPDHVIIEERLPSPSPSPALDESTPGRFPCSHCDKSYSRRTKLKIHLCKMHSEEIENEEVEAKEKIPLKDLPLESVIQYACHLCPKAYTRKDKLKHHLKNRHQTLQMPQLSVRADFFCSKCQKSYKTQLRFDRHLLQHDPQPFHCILCDAAFVQRKDWRLHENNCLLLTALGNGHHECPVCGQIFPKMEDFKGHLLEEKNSPLVCRKCSESSSSLLQLALHNDANHASSLECPSCGKSFESRKALKKHADRMHGHHGNLQCQVCDVKLSRPDKLADHMLCYHTDIRCTSCSETFATRAEYARHRLRDHGSPGTNRRRRVSIKS